MAAGVAAACALACVPPSQLRAQRLGPELDALRYAQPPAEVWNAVRRLLADRGYPLAGADAEAVGQKTAPLAGLLSPARETHPYREETGLLQQLGAAGGPPAKPAEGSVSLDTDWSRKRGDRYRADGLVLPDGFRVVFTRVEFDPSNYKETRTRDLELELELARRLDPPAAERIERAAATPPPK
jgi:hypothetical protein